MKFALISTALAVLASGCNGSGNSSEMEPTTVDTASMKVDSRGVNISNSPGVMIGDQKSDQNGNDFEGIKLKAHEMTGPRFKVKGGVPLSYRNVPTPAGVGYASYWSNGQIPAISDGVDKLTTLARMNAGVTLQMKYLRAWSLITDAFAAIDVSQKTVPHKDLLTANAGTFFKKQINETDKVDLTKQGEGFGAKFIKIDGRTLSIHFDQSKSEACAIMESAMGAKLSRRLLGKDSKGRNIPNPLASGGCSESRLDSYKVINISPVSEEASDKKRQKMTLIIDKKAGATGRMWLFESTPSPQESKKFHKLIKAFL